MTIDSLLIRASRRTVLAMALTFALAIAWIAAPTAGASPTSGGSLSEPLTATAAGNLTLKETALLHLLSQKTGALNEQGAATGTRACHLTVYIKIAYTTVSLKFIACSGHNKFSGAGEAVYYTSGPISYFHGTLTVLHGTGTYAGASGKLSIKGTLNRDKNYQMTAQIDGTMHE